MDFISNPYSAESDGLLVAHLPPVDTDTCQVWYSEDEIDIDFDVHKCFGYEDGRQERFILIDEPLYCRAKSEVFENTFVILHTTTFIGWIYESDES